MASKLLRESQFVTVNGRRLTGACGPNAAGALARRVFQNDMYTTVHVAARMMTLGLCDSNGVTTPDHISAYLKQAGLGTIYSGWQPLGWNFQQWLTSSGAANAAQNGYPAVLEPTNGQALVDYLSGKGENARDLKNHFICLMEFHAAGFSRRANKSLPAGWWCADGDNLVAGNVLQFYPLTVLTAARPRAAIVVKRSASIAWLDAAPVWTYASDGSATDNAGHHVGGGVGSFLRAQNVNVPAIGPEVYYTSDHAWLPLADGRSVEWDNKAGKASWGNPAARALDFYQSYQTVQQQLAAAQAAQQTAASGSSAPSEALRAAVAAVATATAQLQAALEAEPPAKAA